MKTCSLKTRLGSGLAAGLVAGILALALARTAAGAESPPELYRSAPIIPYAKTIGEHRFRSPRTYDDTLTYYKKVFQGTGAIGWEKIVNTSGIRGMHMKNKAPDGRWEGLNIYEHEGRAIIFVVFSDKELKAIAEEKRKAEEKKKGGKSSPPGKKPGK
jgi:hypothetical protein